MSLVRHMPCVRTVVLSRRPVVAGGRFVLGLVVGGLAAALACGAPERPLAGDGAGTGNYFPQEGPCSPDGTVRECHVRLGESGGALGCFIGTQECHDGRWTACGGGEITLATVDLALADRTASAGLRPLALAVSDSGVCTLDPCDPYCVGYNEDAGLTAEGGAPTAYVNETSMFGGAPGGFAKKSDCGSSGSGCNSAAPGAAYPRKCNGEDHFSIWDACLADTHCDTSKNGGKGACVGNWDETATSDPRWDEANNRWLPAICPGVDLTVSAACEVAGVPGFNICNRGNTTATAATIGLYIDNGNGDFGSSTHASGACPDRNPSCSPAVPGGSLAPGACFRVTNANCPAWSGNGNPVAYVNPKAAIAECGGLAAATASTAPGCNNNWADVKNKGDVCGAVGATFVPTSRSFTYQATCTPGYLPRWKALTYAATVPCSPGACSGTNTGRVEFFGALSTKLLDGATTTAGESVIGAATTTKTVSCTFGVDAGGQPKCPVDLLSWANGVASGGANYARLDLRILLTPTPDAAEAPTVSSWSVSYDCIPYE
jgi:hypothetical protein